MGNRMKRWAAAALCALLTLGLAGCDLPMLGFADYDVSAYLQALLDSSYKNSHAQFLEVAGGDASAAQANNDTTVENTAVEFCNTYNLAMDETQMDRLEEILGEALAQARYTVKEEQKVDTGYYIEVEITPILNYQGLEPRLQELEEEAHEEATSVEGVSQEGDVVTVDVNQLYLDKVLDYCEEQLSQLQYDTAPQTIALDIRQTSQGELQLDMNQIKTIDETVLRLAS